MLPVAFLAENTEGVHKVRVSLRRMRALLKIVRPYYQKKFLVATRIDLKFIRDVHGRVRDMDVFHQNFALNFSESHPGEDYQSAIWQPVFNQTYQDYLSQIRSAVTQDITQQLIQTLNKFQNSNELLEDQKLIDSLPQNIAAFLPAALNNQLEKILEFQLHPDGDRQYSSHHQLRLLAKAHRYTYEFFQSVLEPEPTQQLITAMTSLQDHLGELNDTVQAIRLITSHQSLQMSSFVSSTLSDYGLALREKQNILLTTLPDVWGEFVSANPHSMLNEAIAPLKKI